MIKSIKIKNFYSINAEQSLHFDVLKKDVKDESVKLLTPKSGINLVMCVIGPNASGKTNALKALTFLMWLVDQGYSGMKDDDTTGAEAFKLNFNKPTNLEIEFINKKELYVYRISLNSKQILAEYLGKKRQRGFTRIFEYDIRNEKKWNLVAPDLDINKSDAKRFLKRKSVPLLSSLISTDYLPDINFFQNGMSNVTNIGLAPEHPFRRFFNTSEKLFKHQSLRKSVLSLIRDMDFGISDFSFKEVTLRNPEKPNEEKKAQALECIHTIGKKSFELELIDESNGTQIGIAMLSEILTILERGGIAILDEIESHLHPHVIKKIISLFESKETNPNNAQLLFSTHQHLLINDRNKTQIYIAEKSSKSLETEIYRLDEVKGIRNDDNYFHKYMAGTYGGTPNIKWQ